MSNPFEGWKPGEFYGEIVDGKGHMAAKFLDGCDAVSFLDMAKAFSGLDSAVKAALSQLVALGGNPSDEYGDKIQAAVIKQITDAIEAAEKIGE